jgi:Polyketide cyclase / dehydrase and lipid transport
MQLAPLLVLVSLAQAAASGWTAVGNTRGVARALVVHVQGQPAPDGPSRCQWTNLEKREPERKGIVRMPILRGSWTIEPLDATRSRMVYQVAVDPDGRLPEWLVRRGAVNALPDVIEQVRRRLGGER